MLLQGGVSQNTFLAELARRNDGECGVQVIKLSRWLAHTLWVVDDHGCWKIWRK
jgi:hypothetical protein